MTTLPDDIRDRYWSGDLSSIDGYRDPDARTIIVDLNLASRIVWRQTRGMTEAEIEAYENNVNRAAAMRKARPVVISKSKTLQPATWGYDRLGNPIVDNDLSFAYGIVGVIGI